MTNEELLQAITVQIGSLRQEMNRRFDAMEERIETLEEDGEITRDGVNSLLEWADMIGKLNNYPIAK